MPRKKQGRLKLSSLQAKLAAEIIEFARRNELSKGTHLVEENLATEFGVSRSPVRFALFYLSKIGLVDFRPNYGFYLADDAAALDTETLQLPETEEQRLYDLITRDRVKGNLSDSETEAEMMRRYRVNRGLLTRVLLRLSQEGIAQRGDGYGWIFTPTFNSETAHDESYRFRIILEPSGLLEATFKIDEKRMANARQAHEEVLRTGGKRITEAEMFEINAEFHEMLAAFSGNRFLLQAAEQQNRLRRLVEHRSLSAERAVESCREHLAIMDALDAGDREWAASLLRRHLELARQLRWPSELTSGK